ncbi:MAG: hypothetical protein Q7U55_11765, partial [Deltaproteobacteria bacterium]|nr:hypothetical protein [Deltaproteobacteria bacterium]
MSEKTYHSENLPLPVRQAGYNPSLPSGLEAKEGDTCPYNCGLINKIGPFNRYQVQRSRWP